MFNIFKKNKKKEITTNYSILGVDIHSHLIPGIDDGAPDVSTSLELLRQMAEMGYRKVITTPHVYKEFFPNTKESILEGLAELNEALEIEEIDIQVGAAAEYFMDEHFAELLEKKELLTLKDNYVLVEMSFFSPPPQLEEYLFNLQIKGYQPVLAHPERYLFWEGKMDKYRRLKELGCLLQLNLLSLTGHYGKDVETNAKDLLKAGLIDLAGTDLHNEHHADKLHDALLDKKVVKVLEEYRFRNKELFYQ